MSAIPWKAEKADPSAVSHSHESLDPVDWEAFRELAHRALDEMIDFQRDVRSRPAWQAIPPSVETRFAEGPPRTGLGTAGALSDFREMVMPYATGNVHPRFWGWVTGTGSPSGMLAEMLAAGINCNSGPFNDAASRVDAQVVDWMRDALGFPHGTTGVITSGGSVANLIGLAVARDSVLANSGSNVPLRGVEKSAGQPLLYASTEVHSSILKAAQLLGLGREALRPIPINENFEIRIADLEKALAADRERGARPFAIVANAGTVNTGATDDLEALADIAQREGLWLHVDGAFGAMTRLTNSHAAVVRGLERADSVAFDFHKWMYMPYEAGCVLIRNTGNHRTSFEVPATYLETLPRGVGAQPDSTNERGLQLSRGFKALKVWMLIKEHGLARYGRLIERNISQAKQLAQQVDDSPELERLAPVPLNVVCFRYTGRKDKKDPSLDRTNRELLMRLQEDGLAVPSSTRIQGHFALRVAIVNQRSQTEDFDFLVENVKRLGKEIET